MHKPGRDPQDIIQCLNPAQLSLHLQDMQALFLQPESEHNWEKFAKALNKLAALTRGGGYKLDSYSMVVGPTVGGGVGDNVVSCILSERAALSKAGIDLLSSFAPRLAGSFNSTLQRLYLPPLLDLVRRTNNIVRQRAETVLYLILETCPPANLVRMIASSVGDANVNLRRAVGRGMATIARNWGRDVRADDVENVVRRLAGDKDPEARKLGKELWEEYCGIWPERVDVFMGPLTPVTRKRLGPRPAPLAYAATSASGPHGASSLRQTSSSAPASRPPSALSSASSTSSLHRTVANPATASTHAARPDPAKRAPTGPSTSVGSHISLSTTAPARPPLAPPLSAPPPLSTFPSRSSSKSSTSAGSSSRSHATDGRSTLASSASSSSSGSRHAATVLSRPPISSSTTSAPPSRPILALRTGSHARSASAVLSSMGPPARVAPRVVSSSAAQTAASTGGSSKTSALSRSVMGAPVRGGSGGGLGGGWMPKARTGAVAALSRTTSSTALSTSTEETAPRKEESQPSPAEIAQEVVPAAEARDVVETTEECVAAPLEGVTPPADVPSPVEVATLHVDFNGPLHEPVAQEDGTPTPSTEKEVLPPTSFNIFAEPIAPTFVPLPPSPTPEPQSAIDPGLPVFPTLGRPASPPPASAHVEPTLPASPATVPPSPSPAPAPPKPAASTRTAPPPAPRPRPLVSRPRPPPVSAPPPAVPAVRRERVKLKAPLPSFRPTSKKRVFGGEVDLNKLPPTEQTKIAPGVRTSS